jgi:hypothetical protein
MNKELVDLKSLEPALQSFLFESSTPEEGLMVILQNPQLLTDFVETLFASLIDDAKQDGNDELVDFYSGRLMLLQTVREVLSKKDATLLHIAKLMLSKKEDFKEDSKTDSSSKTTEWFDFQDIMVKTLVWLKAPTLEQGVKILRRYPELLTDKPIRMLSFLMEEAHNRGDEMFVQVLKTLREFFQSLRLNLIDKKGATTEELKKAVKQALTQTDFSTFTDRQEFSFLA